MQLNLESRWTLSTMANNNSRLLIDEAPMLVLPSLIKAVGNNSDRAIILQQLHYFINMSKHDHDGRKWVYNSVKKWQIEQFQWMSTKTVQRHLNFLEENGFLITGNYNKAKFDKTKWYSIDYDKLDEALSQIDTTIGTKSPNGNGQNDQTNTRDYTETTSDKEILSDSDKSDVKSDPKIMLEIEFEKLWKEYPLKAGKEPAKKSFYKWRKQGDSYDEILLGIQNYKKSKYVKDGFIMKGSKFFNQRSWKDEYSSNSPSELISGKIVKEDVF